MKATVLIVATLALSILPAGATPQDQEFEKLAAAYVEQELAANPERATELGDHRFDGELTDYSTEKRAQLLSAAKDLREKLSGFSDLAELTGPNKIDIRILRDAVDNEIFELEELREAEWNPLVYMQSLANGLYVIVARDFDTPEKRIANLRKRMEAIPRVIE